MKKFLGNIFKFFNSRKKLWWLDYLSNQIGGRLSGSLNAERAVNWTKSVGTTWFG